MSHTSSKPQNNFQSTMTPSGIARNNLKPPARKLWNYDKPQRGKAKKSENDDGRYKYECPQFVDLATVAMTSDSFFSKHSVIVSTPKDHGEPGSSIHSYHENTLIQSFDAFPLSGMDIATPEKQGQNVDDINTATIGQSVNKVTVIPVETNESKNCMEATESPKIPKITVGCHGRDESKEDNKPELIKKNSEEDKNPWVFREKENSLKTPGRKLWNCDQLKSVKARAPEKCRNSRKDDGFGEFYRPKFVDFSDLPKTDDSFFGKDRVIVSTPKVGGEPGSSTHTYHENTLIQSLEAFSLSRIDIVAPQKIGQTTEDVNESSLESVNNITIISMETNEHKNRMEVNKPLKTATSAPKFHGRDEGKQVNKPKPIKKNLEEDKQLFRAKPVPKYLIARKMELNKNKNNSAETMECGGVGKERKLQCPNKNKENREAWKKPPLVPCTSQKNLCRPKSPPLRTKGRAEERKQFDQSVKLNEMKVNLQRQTDLQAKREQEEKEIALLRKQTVHKAQPIRKYKLGLPKIQKRPLTDPQTPLTLKRRRIESSK